MEHGMQAPDRSRTVTAPSLDAPSSAPMARGECLARLALEPVGRLIVPRMDLPPVVVPAIYLLRGETLMVRSTETLPSCGFRSRHLIFEVDRIDADRRRGWSVVVEGVTRTADGPDDEDGWLSLPIDVVRGRRLGDEEPSEAGAGW